MCCNICWTLMLYFVCYLSECSQMYTHRSGHYRDQYQLFVPSLLFCVFQRGERVTDLKDQIANWTFCLSDRSPGTMLTILAAGSVFFPGLFLLSKQCLKSIPALRWSERDAVIVSARWDLPKCFQFLRLLHVCLQRFHPSCFRLILSLAGCCCV